VSECRTQYPSPRPDPKVLQFQDDRHDGRGLAETVEAEHSSKTALLLGGGAPNAALMAGALAAFEDHKVTVDVISTSGAGGLIALLWLAPKGCAPREALGNCVNAYVADQLYEHFPIAFKIFFKPGPMTYLLHEIMVSNPITKSMAEGMTNDPNLRLLHDCLHLAWASMIPSSLNPNDVGLCARVPWADTLIDFEHIKSIEPYFYLNAYNVTDKRMENFNKYDMTVEHFRAASAFPFIYGPYEPNGKSYCEGGSLECLNFHDILSLHPGLERIVVFDVLGHEGLIRKPRNLYDSWVLSMIIPLVRIAQANIDLFALRHNHGYSRENGAKADIMIVPFDIDEEHLPNVLDWSYSNGKKLFEIGYRSGERFLQGEGACLLPSSRIESKSSKDG
jgi:NTE family protein